MRSEHPDLEISYCESVEQMAVDADALVLVTEWADYREIDWAELRPRMRTPVILDGRQSLDRYRLNSMGFRCLSVAG
jgi:UDPglucose 6-dehydrogenase